MLCKVLALWTVGWAFGAYPSTPASAQPAAPERLVERTGDGSVILHWNPNLEPELKGYRVYRAIPSDGTDPVPYTGTLRSNHFVDFDVENGTTYAYFVQAVDQQDRASVLSAPVEARPDSLDDEAFLDLVQATAFDFFWYEANPENGLIRDRSSENSACSIASVGFGLSAVTVGIDRGWISREEGRERVLTTLEFFWNSRQGREPDATGYRGFYYHFLNMDTGRRAGLNELSTIDTALLLAGVLHAGAYFDQEAAEELRIRALADSLFDRVEWTWIQPRAPKISMGWKPESGFIGADWNGYNEAMILYIMALGSDTHMVTPFAWNVWTTTYSWQTHYGLSFLTFPPLFGHQYSHAWIDFRGIQDPFMRNRSSDYFENSRRATLAQRAYAIANPGKWKDYGEHVWGITASDTPTGYRARGAPPPQNDDGTIAPTAAGGSYAFTPDESLAALRHMYTAYLRRLWWRYGFRDAFNPTRDWYASDHIGIDQGPILLMIENGRTGRVWEVFMRSKVIQQGLYRAGFRPVVVSGEFDLPASSQPEPLLIAYPNPAAHAVHVRFVTASTAPGELIMVDLLGRTVSERGVMALAHGEQTVRLDTGALPAGVYLLRLRTGDEVASQPIVIRR